MAIVIRRLQENQVHLANEFFNRIYGTDRSVEHFRWEFLRGPNGPALYVAAFDDSNSNEQKVVGIQCVIPIQFQNVHGDVIMTGKSEDTLVDPQYRGQKIFERMYELLFEECKKAGIKYIWGFTPARKAFDRITFEVPFQAQQALLVFKPYKAYRYLSSLNPGNKSFDKLKIAGLTALSALQLLFTRVRPTQNLVVKATHVGDKQQVFRELWGSPSLYFLRMDASYVKWRILENPCNNAYSNYQFFSGDTLVADVIVNLRGTLGYIEQIIFKEQLSEKLKQEVVQHVINIMRPQADLIRVLCFDANEELKSQMAAFKAAGFVVLNRGAHFVWKATDEAILDPGNVFLTRLFTQGNQ
jgi:GNAT superfamily N-acetyltransferase